MLKWFHGKTKRILALLLSGSILTGTLAYGLWIDTTSDANAKLSFSSGVNDALRATGGVPTGLSFETTITNKTLTLENAPQWAIDDNNECFGFGKFWLNGVKPTTELMELLGSKEQISIDFSKFDHTYATCVADHSGDGTVVAYAFNGWQMAAKEVFYPTQFQNDYPKFIEVACGGDIERMKFNLLLTALMHGKHGKVAHNQITANTSDTAYAAAMYCQVRVIDGGRGFDRNSGADAAWQQVLDCAREIEVGYSPNKDNTSEVWEQFNGPCKDYFKECYEIASFLSRFTFTTTTVTPPLTAPALNASGQYSVICDYSTWDETAKKYMQAVKVKEGLNKASFVNDGSKIEIAAATLDELNNSLGTCKLIVDSSVTGSTVNIAPAGLIGFKQVGFRDGIMDAEHAMLAGQERFGAYQQELTINLVPPTTTGNPDPTPDSHDIKVDRYKHTEQFQATYNINLRKFDSETGQPLENSWFDVLEAFDDSQLSSTDLESMENWQNENGSQFIRWDGWDYGDGNMDGDQQNDPCDVDYEITNKDGLLINRTSNETAHTDIKTYIYEKGFCGGHPLPDTSGMDEEEEEAIMEAWQEEVDKCERLAAEGGFFHSETEGEAQKQLEEDRDEYYRQFISLTYDYSAVEVTAREGYMVHGVHTDDIPIETKTVTSSEWKIYNSNGNEIPHTAGSSSDSSDDEEKETFYLSSGANRIKAYTLATNSDAMEENTVEIVKKAELSDLPETSWMMNGTENVTDDEEEIKDIEIIPEDRNAGATPSDATGSDALQDLEAALHDMFVEAHSLVSDKPVGKKLSNMLFSFFASGDLDDNGESNSGGHPERDSTIFEESVANRIDPLESSIIDHTFTVFDHRTEGEIHINKRDLSLQTGEGDNYDSYAEENADGTLEGAVYGLFTANDLIHSDGKTGIVYKKDDLVSVATTDRNGDASFMTFTEAPGMTYDYEQGKVVERDTGWNEEAPKNLHQIQDAGDIHAEDNEQYIGYDSQYQEISLDDSKAGDETVYFKHSSNQDGIEGLDGGHETYPISNNEDNNGNCWIGRPLFCKGQFQADYYVKELSRSEGYELSVNGKKNQITNGKGNQEKVYVTPTVSVSKPRLVEIQRAFFSDLTAENVTGDLHITGTGFTEDTKFAISTRMTVTETRPVAESKEKSVAVIGTEGDYVYINGNRVIADVGDVIDLNGISYQVTRTGTDGTPTEGIFPQNISTFGTPAKTSYGTSDLDDFQNAYNEELKAIGYKTPSEESPWIRIKLSGRTESEWIAALTEGMKENGLIYYNRVEIRDILTINGTVYALVSYEQRTNGGVADNGIYNPDTETLYVKKETGNGYFVYVPYGVGDQAVIICTQEGGFVTLATIRAQEVVCSVSYPNELPSVFTMRDVEAPSYWVYDGVMQKFNNDGTLATKTEWVTEYVDKELNVEKEEIIPLVSEYTNGIFDITIPFSLIEERKNLKIKIYGEENYNVQMNRGGTLLYQYINMDQDSYIENFTLDYPGQDSIIETAKTIGSPKGVQERPIRQKVKINKDIQTLAEPKVVWYCLNCGYENQENEAECGYCGHERTTEETKTIYYAHDTYSAVHSDNISAERDAGWYQTAKDWLTKLLGGGVNEESATNIPNFRFKAYLKSNLERLYRNEDGNITWIDRNGNIMSPQYEDTNGDGNYDTFTWKYETAYDGKTVDFPEKDVISDDGTLESTNVQKIYTKIDHVEDSKTTSAQANNVWSDYDSPQTGSTYNVGEKENYTTSEREKSDGTAGDLDGMAVRTNSALYSYDGKNDDVAVSDKINADQNTGYTRLLEMTKAEVEDGAGKTRTIETYNYEKFFDAIYAANTDIWDGDMHSTYTGTGMSNYPGQHWFETFYEKYQKDDADPDHTLENTDGADSDNTAGGDHDTSFKPFRWIREHVFGDRSDYEKYPAEHNGVNTEVVTSTSDFARANAEASDAVRQFAEKWYLEQEAGKLMINNGVDEDIAKADGTIDYDEAVYDEALFNAIAKAYNYLKPFYMNDLDTIYSVEWDSAANGGSDKDYTTLSIDLNGGDEHYNISSYLPYGVYVIVEQQPERRDKSVNDWENRSYSTEKPKEVIIPSVYDAAQPNDTTDNYDTHYDYTYDMTTQEQAKADNYLIRFGEEWAHNNTQDEREYVIRAHNYYGDFEVYKYGLDIDKLHAGERNYSGITYPAGSYDYAGWKYTQEQFDPLKDYYDTAHAGEDTVDAIGAENGGNDNSDYMAIDKTNGADTANGSTYDGKALQDRFFYAGISEDAGKADNVMYKGGGTDDNNVSGMQWEDNVRAMTGELTAYEGKYAAMLVPWTVTAPADHTEYSSEDFSGYADVNERNSFYTAMLKINKVDSETGEYILHDNAIFGLYAGSRYQTFDEIEADAKLIEDKEEREMFLNQFRPGDAKFYLQDTVIEGTREFLMAMGATEITPFSKGRSIVESGAGVGELCTGLVKKGTPVCVEAEKIMLTDEIGARTGQMTVYTTLNDVLVAGEVNAADKTYANQNTGYFITPQPIGAGVYVLAELKAPEGYARSKPITFEVYSDKTSYYVDGDMYNKVNAVRQEGNLLKDIRYNQ